MPSMDEIYCQILIKPQYLENFQAFFPDVAKSVALAASYWYFLFSAFPNPFSNSRKSLDDTKCCLYNCCI